MSFDVVLFDLDGVLVDSRAAFARSVNAGLEGEGVACRSESALARFIGDRLIDVFRELLAEAGDPSPPPARLERCIERYRGCYREVAPVETTLVPGIDRVVERVAQDRPVAVATARPSALAEPLLRELGLSEVFDGIFGPDLAAEAERKPSVVGRALEALRPARSPVLVGDRHHDVEAGRANGIATIGVLWGIGDEAELRGAGADEIVGSPAELERLLVR